MKKFIITFIMSFFKDRVPTIDFVNDRVERRVMSIVCKGHEKRKASIPSLKAQLPVKHSGIDINCYYSQPI